MENEKKSSGLMIFVYLIPVYILIAIPLIRWTASINSGEVNLSKEAENAFNSQEGEIRRSSITASGPELKETAYSVYQKQGRSQGGAAAASGATTDYKRIGMTNGAILKVLYANARNYDKIRETLDDQDLIDGFMGRRGAGKLLSNKQALYSFLKDSPAVEEFSGSNRLSRLASDQNIIKIFAESRLASAILSSPAPKALLNDHKACLEIVSGSPSAMTFLKKKAVMAALGRDPRTARAAAYVKKAFETGR